LFGSHGFLHERRQGESIVELMWFAFLFRVGLTQFFVGVALSDSGGNVVVGLGQFFCLRGGRDNILLGSRG
jgi:hypothetical protein